MFLRRRMLTFALLCCLVYLVHHRLDPIPSPPSRPVVSSHETTLAEAYAHYGFVRGISTFQPDNLTKHLVLPRTDNDDVNWLWSLPPWLQITPKVYYIPTAPPLPPQEGVLTVPKNKGNEAMAYLTYLIDHYDALPDLVVFTHASTVSWHNNDMHMLSTPLMLRELNYNRAQRLGFMNLRCHWKPGCPAWIIPYTGRYDGDKGEEFYFSGAFKSLFPNVEMPEVFAGACCAQFVVTRERIRGNTREEYRAWREWLMDTDLPDRFSGRILEYLWHYIFSPRENRETTVCPKEHICYCDGYGMCFGGDNEYKEHLELGKDTVHLEQQLQAALNEGPKTGEYKEWQDREIRQMRVGISKKRTRLEEEIASARERGRSAEVRRREVGEAEFSG